MHRRGRPRQASGIIHIAIIHIAIIHIAIIHIAIIHMTIIYMASGHPGTRRREAQMSPGYLCSPHSQRILLSRVHSLVMNESPEYVHALTHLYEKSLILHDTSQFHPVLRFYFFDSLAHLDYTIGVLAFNFQSVKNLMTGEYLRWRIDEEKKGDMPLFPPFVNWLRKEHPDRFARLPSLWQRIYHSDDPASYRSFRIVLDPDVREAPSATQCFRWTDEFFEKEFLKSIYLEASLSTLFETFRTGRRP